MLKKINELKRCTRMKEKRDHEYREKVINTLREIELIYGLFRVKCNDLLINKN